MTKTTTSGNKTEDGTMSFLDRIRMRESKGEIKAFDDAYKTTKESPAKLPTEPESQAKASIGTRKAPVVMEKKVMKKIKIDSDDELLLPEDFLSSAKKENAPVKESDGGFGLAARPKRAVAGKKMIVESDDNADKDEDFEEYTF